MDVLRPSHIKQFRLDKKPTPSPAAVLCLGDLLFLAVGKNTRRGGVSQNGTQLVSQSPSKERRLSPFATNFQG